MALNYCVNIYIMSSNSKNSLENILTKRLNIPIINKVKTKKVLKKILLYLNIVNENLIICDYKILIKVDV